MGFGEVVDVDRRPINQYAGGEAFERARKAADALKQSNPKYRTVTQFETGIPLFDQVANSVYHLTDTLLEGLSEKQWRAIQAQMRFGSVSLTARTPWNRCFYALSHAETWSLLAGSRNHAIDGIHHPRNTQCQKGQTRDSSPSYCDGVFLCSSSCQPHHSSSERAFVPSLGS